jgi:hypothetical protein
MIIMIPLLFLFPITSKIWSIIPQYSQFLPFIIHTATFILHFFSHVSWFWVLINTHDRTKIWAFFNNVYQIGY